MADDSAGDAPPENVGERFDRLPETAEEREVPGRSTRAAVLDWWESRFGVDPAVFSGHTFWERGAGKIWAFSGDAPTPIDIEGLGMAVLRTRQEHWKPTLEAVQRFGQHATRNVMALDREAARTFLRGDDQELDWDGDWGYVVVTIEFAGGREPLGVGLYVYGELRSQVPKGRRRDL
jgi:NOL1/NOP2/fmu family ribosome biogenesis protein